MVVPDGVDRLLHLGLGPLPELAAFLDHDPGERPADLVEALRHAAEDTLLVLLADVEVPVLLRGPGRLERLPGLPGRGVAHRREDLLGRRVHDRRLPSALALDPLPGDLHPDLALAAALPVPADDRIDRLPENHRRPPSQLVVPTDAPPGGVRAGVSPAPGARSHAQW